MKRSSLFRLLRTVLTLLMAGVPVALTAAPGEGELPREPINFRREVRPLLAEHCIKCHGPEKQKGGLRLDLKSALQGASSKSSTVAPLAALGSIETTTKSSPSITTASTAG